MLNNQKTNKVVGSLFEVSSKKPVLPKLDENILEDYYDEMELICFCVSGKLFDLAKSAYLGNVNAVALIEHEGKIVQIVGDLYVRSS